MALSEYEVSDKAVNGDGKFKGRDTNRVPLHSVVPLEIPFAIGLSPSDICNFRCKFCAQSTGGGVKDAKILSWDDFIFVANQMEDMLASSSESRFKIIRFIGLGEPLVNKLTPDMVRYCVDHGMADRYEVTTNASLLSHEMSDKLIDAGLTRLLISVEGMNPEKYKEICGFRLNWDKFLDGVSYFYQKSRGKCKLYVKIVNVSLDSDEEKQMFYDTFTPISDMCNVENIIESTEGVDFSFIKEKERGISRYTGERIEKNVCDTLFMYLNVHSNGDVDSCGCIYPPMFYGNIYETPLKELWNGTAHRYIMTKHLKGRRCDLSPCDKCQSITGQGGFEADNLDPYMDEILKRIGRWAK